MIIIKHSRSKSNPNLTYRPKSAREGQSPSKTPNRVRPEEKSPNQKWKFFKEIQAKFDRPVR